MHGILVPVIAIVCSLGIPIVAIVTDYYNKRNKWRALEKALENGVSLEGLSIDGNKGPRVPYRSGMVTLAAGIGVAILGVLVGQLQPQAIYPTLGAGIVLILIGTALIINDKLNYERLFKSQ